MAKIVTTIIGMVTSITNKSFEIRFLTSLFLGLTCASIATNFGGSRDGMDIPVSGGLLLPLSHSGTVVFGVWFLSEMVIKVWQWRLNREFVSCSSKIYSCLKEASQEAFKSSDPAKEPPDPKVCSSIQEIENILAKKFGISSPTLYESDTLSLHEGLSDWEGFLLRILDYAKRGDLKGAKDFSKTWIEEKESDSESL